MADFGNPAHKDNSDAAMLAILKIITDAVYPSLRASYASRTELDRIGRNLRFEVASTAVLDRPLAGLFESGEPPDIDENNPDDFGFEALLLKAFDIYGERHPHEPPAVEVNARRAWRQESYVPARLRQNLGYGSTYIGECGGYADDLLALIAPFARSVLRP